jgi:hypothetical protein
MIKAINTRYKGYNFRSRTEARWAVFFDAIGLKWEYEKEGYVLSNGQRYLPDFYIPGWGWIEIKGDWPTDEEIEKARLLSIKKNDSYKDSWVMIINGLPDPINSKFMVFHDGKEEECGALFTSYTVRKWGSTPYYGEFEYDKDDLKAIKKSRSARFEFNEDELL